MSTSSSLRIVPGDCAEEHVTVSSSAGVRRTAVPLNPTNPRLVMGNLNFGMADAVEASIALNATMAMSATPNNRATFMFVSSLVSRNEFYRQIRR